MAKHKKLQSLDDYFLELDQRIEKGVFFYRINGYDEGIKLFIQRYYDAARRSGVVIEGRIQNPTEQNLSYYLEMMGPDFELSMGFLTESLKKWLPRMNDYQRSQVAGSIYDVLDLMRRRGKTENMLKNAYIKFACWLYYRFERIVNQLGNNQLPKILYEGDVGINELYLLSVLSNAGCDVILLQYHGDGGYRSIDKDEIYSMSYSAGGLGAFPEGFSLKGLRSEIEKQVKTQRLFGPPPDITNCTNAWTDGNGLNDILKEGEARGEDRKLFYNCFCRINGVEDKQLYLNELYQFYLQLENSRRNVTVVNQVIPKPSMDEISAVKRNNYKDFEQMAADLSGNIRYTASMELQKIMRKAFVDILGEENAKPGMNLNRLMNKGIYLLCWLKRYQPRLFTDWKPPETACFIYMGGCRDENESLFVKMLARLPVDVLILAPDLNRRCVLEDSLLYQISNSESLKVDQFPSALTEIQMGTAAYHAEQELESIMYQDSGIYRNRQCSRANAITLKTMYEEIGILWDQELKYRPNFSVVDDVVNIPVLYAKVSGVKDGDLRGYWSDIKKLITGETYVVKKPPLQSLEDANPLKPYATEFLKNGKLQIQKIKSHKAYSYGVLREEIQTYMLDKLQMLLDQKGIKGIYENGTEYTVVSTVLNLNRDIVRLIQQFDFTKKNPKLIYINATEKAISLEDSIITAFLNLMGFDVVFFIPTGYQTVEGNFNQKAMEEHQIGGYMYDLQAPDFGRFPTEPLRLWRDKLFKRGS